MPPVPYLHNRGWPQTTVACLVQAPGGLQQLCNSHQSTKLLLYYGAYIHWGMDGLHGNPQGEQIQWHDLYVTLLLMGYRPHLVHTQQQLSAAYLDAYDLVIIDYAGVMYAMDEQALERHRCKLRLMDVWGTDAGPNMRDGKGFCCLKLPSLAQFWTFTPTGPSPQNSFLGYMVPSFRLRHEFEGAQPHRKMEVLLYGKEYKIFKEDHKYIHQLADTFPTHATAKDWPAGTLTTVKNHGVLDHTDLHALMRELFVYAGFAAIMLGPAALEAMSQGMVFLNYAFVPPRNLSITQGKPTIQLWTSQFPFLEQQAPHAFTINVNDPSDVLDKLQLVKSTYTNWWVLKQFAQLQPDAVMGDFVFLGKTRGHRSGYVPYEYTSVAFLLRVDKLIRQNYCLSKRQIPNR